MTKGNITTCVYENNRVTFKSNICSFTPELFNEFDLKAKKIGLHSKIDDFFIGKKVNYTENLAAWHSKYRDNYDINDNDSLIFRTDKVQSIFSDAKNVVTLGIGGSFEGPKMFFETLNLDIKDTNFIFITGSDPSEFISKTSQLNPEDTIFLVSSKSFTTDETINLLKEAISWSGKMNKFIAITANKSEAEKYNIPNIVEFDKEIGGRYSIWSNISVLIKLLKPSAFDNFMIGGKRADIDLKENDGYLKFVKNLAFSDIWLHNYKNRSSRAVLSYIWNWRSLPSYIQQLEMESLGKQPSKGSEFKKTGQYQEKNTLKHDIPIFNFFTKALRTYAWILLQKGLMKKLILKTWPMHKQ